MDVLRLKAAIGVLALTVLWGCGGSGGGGGSTDDPPKVDEKPTGTALFRVDLESGKVDIQSLTPESRAVFAGSAVTFTSSDVLNEGTLARRRLQVSMANNQPESLLGPLKIRFTNFKNVSAAPTDLRAAYKVATVAGTGIGGSADGSALSATLSGPNGVATDPAGNVYFTGSDGTVRMLRNGVVSTLVTGLVDPRGLAYVASGSGHPSFGSESLIVADAGANRLIRVLINNKTFTVYAGAGAATSLDNTVLTSATFNQPHGVRVVGTGPTQVRFLVTEFAGGNVRSVVDNASGSDSAASSITGLTNPTDVLLVNDATAVVESGADRITFVQGSQRRSVGTGAAGFVNGKGTLAQFDSPQGMALVGDTLFVTEADNRRVRQLDLLPGGSSTSPESWNVATVAGNGVAGSADGTSSTVSFFTPVGIASVNNGLVLADAFANKLRKITSVSTRFPVDLPLGGSTSAELPRLANPTGFLPNDTKVPFIQIGASVNAGQSVVLGNWDFIVPSGITAFEFVVSVEAGTSVLAALDGVTNVGPTQSGGSANVDVRGFAGAKSSGSIDGPLASAAFGNVAGMARDVEGVIYVTDSTNHTIRRIGQSGNVTTILGRPGLGGSTDGRGDEALAFNPIGIACEPDGKTVYFTQANHVVRRLTLTTDFDGNPGNGLQEGDPALAASWQVTTIAGLAAVSGGISGTGAASRFSNPFGLVRTAPGQLFVTETSGNRVRSLQQIGQDGAVAANWQVRFVAGDVTAATGASGNTDSSNGFTVRFNSPRQIALGPDGDLYIADANNHRIRRMEPGGGTSTYAGSVGGYGDATTATAAKFNTPEGIAVDASGVVYVADTNNTTIRKRAIGVQTVAGGTGGFTDGNGKVAKFTLPSCLLVLPDGGLLVGDIGRIRLVQRIIQP